MKTNNTAHYRPMYLVVSLLFFFGLPLSPWAQQAIDLSEKTAEPELSDEQLQQRIEALQKELTNLQELLAARQAAYPTPTRAKAIAQADANKKDIHSGPKASARLTYYYDTRKYSTLNLQTSIENLPGGFTFWGFTDLHGAQHAGRLTEIARYFMEYRLSRPLAKGFGVQAEYNDFAGPRNNLVRLGATYRHKLPLPRAGGWLEWRYFPWESDGKGGQASLIYHIPLTARLSVTGFVDRNWKRRGWVLEPQLNWRLSERNRLVLEFRHNDFECRPLKPKGLAFGFETTLK